MPNYVKNDITLTGDANDIRQMLEEIKDNEFGFGSIDFNKIIPMPERLDIESGSSTDDGIEIALTIINPSTKDFGIQKMQADEFVKLVNGLNRTRYFSHYNINLSDDEIAKMTKYNSMEKLLELGETAVSNYINYGATTWYDWCVSNWGTKWNADKFTCDHEIKKGNPSSFNLSFETA